MRLLRLVKALLVGLFVIAAPRALAGPKRAIVVVYDGWGAANGFFVSGRVLEDDEAKVPQTDHHETQNLVENLKALESDEIRGETVRVTVAGRVYASTTDADGNFSVRVQGLTGNDTLPTGRLPVAAELVPSSRIKTAARGGGELVILQEGPFVAVISDIDDTVVKTFVTDKRRLAATVLLKNATQLESVVGAAANYVAAQHAGAAAIFYLSGSPQNLYRRLQHFLHAAGFPRGPLLLKNIGEDSLFVQNEYKHQRIESLLKMFPQMSVVLVGDSGEKDPEIYRAVRAAHPTRVRGIVIRHAPGSDGTASRFVDCVLVHDAYATDDVVARLVRAQSVVPAAVTDGGTPEQARD